MENHLKSLIENRISALGAELYRGRQISFPSQFEPPEFGGASAAAATSKAFEESRQKMVTEIMELKGVDEEKASDILRAAESSCRYYATSRP